MQFRLALTIAIAFLTASLSGCTEPAASPTDEAATDEAPAVSAPLTIAGNGTLAFGTCQDTSAGMACVLNIGSPTTPGAANIVHFDVPGAKGNITKATATATWQAAGPGFDEIALRISLLADCPDRCRTDKVLVEKMGTSPLQVELADFPVPAGLSLGFSVTRADLQGTGQRVSLLQEFQVDGKVDLAPLASSATPGTESP